MYDEIGNVTNFSNDLPIMDGDNPTRGFHMQPLSDYAIPIRTYPTHIYAEINHVQGTNESESVIFEVSNDQENVQTSVNEPVSNIDGYEVPTTDQQIGHIEAEVPSTELSDNSIVMHRSHSENMDNRPTSVFSV